MCADYDWGSVTLRSVIENMEDGVERVWDRHGGVKTGGEGLVVCSLDCAKVLREIAKIQRRNGSSSSSFGNCNDPENTINALLGNAQTSSPPHSALFAQASPSPRVGRQRLASASKE